MEAHDLKLEAREKEKISPQTLSIPDQIRSALLLRMLNLPNPYEAAQEFTIKAMSAFASQMEYRILEQIFTFATQPDAPGIMLLDNLPRDIHLVATPENGEPHPDQTTFIGEACTLGLAKLIGEPVGYLTEKNGQLIHNIIPVRGAEATQSNRSSKVFLNFHNDSVYDQRRDFHRYNPDFILLYCQRPDRNGQAATYYLDGRDIIADLSTKCVNTLRKPGFVMAAPSNFTMLMNNGKKVWSAPMPILKGSLSYPEIVISANGVEPISEEASRAYGELLELFQYSRRKMEVNLKAGQGLLINNRKGVHARSSFNPSFDAEERWLLRANIRRDVWSMRDRWTGEGMIFD